MNKEEFIKSLNKLNINITKEQLDKLNLYYKLLIKYNENVNLTSIKDENEFYLKHFYDSLTITCVTNLEKSRTLLDIGSGAGFPGVVLKIFYPNLKITLLDSNHKKTDFLNYIIEKLNLKDIEVINKRCEEYIKDKFNYYDIVTARAVANLRVLSELSLPFVKEKGYFIALKGIAEEEIKDAKQTLKLMGANIENKILLDLPKNGGKRTLLLIKKTRTSDIKKIREYNKIIKTSLSKEI